MNPRLKRHPIAYAAAAWIAAFVALAGAGPASAAPYTLWVTETPAGGTAPFSSQFKGGVRSYTFDGLGYSASNYAVGPLVAASGLNDASDVQVAANGSLLIANRGFNTGPGSVSRVTFTGSVPNTPTAALVNIDSGPHQLALTGSGDLVASSLSSGGKLYPGISSPSTVSFASGAQRGTVVYGELLYTTNASGSVSTFNLGTGALATSPLNLAGASLLHYGTEANGSLWFADIGNGVTGAGGGVYRVTLDVNGLPVGSTKVANVDGAISVAFSPTGDEMFVAGHFSGQVTGFSVGPGYSVSATSNLVIDGGTLSSWNGAHVQYGGMDVGPAVAVPEVSTYALMLGGLALLGAAARRRVTPRA